MTPTQSLSDNNNEKITLDEFTQNVIQVHEQHNWPQRSPEERMLYLISEVGELATTLIEVNNSRDNLTDDSKARVSEEMVDVIWNVCALAVGYGLDINAAAKEKLEVMNVRTWDEPR